MSTPWSTFLIGDFEEVDPNNWKIARINGVCLIEMEDGSIIDDPADTGQSDTALIRHGILYLLADPDLNPQNEKG